MFWCEKYITVAQHFILEAYLKPKPFHTVYDHTATKLKYATRSQILLFSVSLILLEKKDFPSSF